MRSTRVAKTAPKGAATAAGPDLPGAMDRPGRAVMAIALDLIGAGLPIAKRGRKDPVEQDLAAKANSIAVVPGAGLYGSAGKLRCLCRS
jgi:hypothetical protein